MTAFVSFNKVADLKTSNVIKKRLQQRCFPVKFSKALRITLMVASEQIQEISVVHCVAK